MKVSARWPASFGESTAVVIERVSSRSSLLRPPCSSGAGSPAIVLPARQRQHRQRPVYVRIFRPVGPPAGSPTVWTI
jgi:hypothetical protein